MSGGAPLAATTNLISATGAGVDRVGPLLTGASARMLYSHSLAPGW